MNPYQKFVSTHWKKSKTWSQNIKDIAKEWHAHRGGTTTKKSCPSSSCYTQESIKKTALNFYQ